MEIFLNVIIIIAALLLIGLVLVQKSKGGGLAADFSSGNNMMGIRRTTDFLEKATWTLAGVIIVCAILSVGISISGKHTKSTASAISERVEAGADDAAQGAAGFAEEADE